MFSFKDTSPGATLYLRGLKWAPPQGSPLNPRNTGTGAALRVHGVAL
jgi:hypothetical protein